MYKAFSLTEILITLGIIGVVASLTLPTLTKNYQKHITANKLKYAYSVLSQAIKLSEAENGFVKEWDEARSISIEAWMDRYLLPYIKYTSKYKNNSFYYLKLPNGTGLRFVQDQTQVQVGVYLDGNFERTISGRNYFVLFIGYPPSSAVDRVFKDSNSPLIPYDYISETVNLKKSKREYIIQKSCNKNNKVGCTALIMLDGWKITDDYPW